MLVVDHDVQLLREADETEIGPGAGGDGGTVIAQGPVDAISADPASRLGPFLDGREEIVVRERRRAGTSSRTARSAWSTRRCTPSGFDVRVPRGRLTAVTGVSGSGKTTLVLETLVPALRASSEGRDLPDHVRALEADVGSVHRIDATPIGVNVRSTVATYSGVLDPLRREFARTPAARRERGLTMGDFSYNTGTLRCPRCEGTGRVEPRRAPARCRHRLRPDCEGAATPPRPRRSGEET